MATIDRTFLSTRAAAAFCGFKTTGPLHEARLAGRIVPTHRRSGRGDYLWPVEALEELARGAQKTTSPPMREGEVAASGEARPPGELRTAQGDKVYVDIAHAADRLSTTSGALRARCRRRARRNGRSVSAHLGGGIVAIKFGTSWRVRFPG